MNIYVKLSVILFMWRKLTCLSENPNAEENDATLGKKKKQETKLEQL